MYILILLYFIMPIIHPISFIKEILFVFSKNMKSISYSDITSNIEGKVFSTNDVDTIIKSFKEKHKLKWYNFGKSVFPSLGTRSSQVYYVPKNILNN